MVRRKKIRIKWKRVILAFILSISICFSLGNSIYKYFNKTKEKENIDNKVSDGIIEEEKIEEYSISLVMVGDALIHDKIYNEAASLGNGSYNFKPMLSLIKPITSEYDLAYYNRPVRYDFA